ncbi:MAG: hypothetical protein FJ272_20100, partial [Planctomycetes bacterium]|nr:hypothetical protein [Planctomycetota bacterium]
MNTKRLLSDYARRLEVDIAPLPRRKVRLALNGDLGSFFAYKLGDRFLWIDYDYPGGVVKQYYECQTRAAFSVNGQDCLELHWDFHERKKGRFVFETQSDLYVAVRPHDVTELLWLHRDARPIAGKPSGNI